jgi:hypothetical protein
LAISFALPTFAQSPQLREALAACDKKEEEAFNNNDAAALAALYLAIGSTATERGPSPAGKGEPGTGIRVPLEAML